MHLVAMATWSKQPISVADTARHGLKDADALVDVPPEKLVGGLRLKVVMVLHHLKSSYMFYDFLWHYSKNINTEYLPLVGPFYVHVKKLIALILSLVVCSNIPSRGMEKVN